MLEIAHDQLGLQVRPPAAAVSTRPLEQPDREGTMVEARPAKRAKRAADAPSVTIPIPVTDLPPPSHYPAYIRGAGPKPGKIRLMPETDDSTGYIVDKLVLPAGPLLDPTVQRRMYYIVGWHDIPHARVAVDCMKAHEYLTPRHIEDWEYDDLCRRDAEQQAAAFAALDRQAAAAPARRKPARPPKNRILADADDLEAEEEALRGQRSPPSGPSLSTPQKARAAAAVLGDVGSDEDKRLLEHGADEPPGSSDEEMFDAQEEIASDQDEENEDDLLQQVLLEQAERNARAEELDDDYDDYNQYGAVNSARTTIVRLDNAPGLQELPARAARSKPSLPAPRAPAHASLPPRAGAASGSGASAAGNYGEGSSSGALPRFKAGQSIIPDRPRPTAVDSVLPAAACVGRSLSPAYTGKGKQPVRFSHTPIPIPTYAAGPSSRAGSSSKAAQGNGNTLRSMKDGGGGGAAAQAKVKQKDGARTTKHTPVSTPGQPVHSTPRKTGNTGLVGSEVIRNPASTPGAAKNQKTLSGWLKPSTPAISKPHQPPSTPQPRPSAQQHGGSALLSAQAAKGDDGDFDIQESSDDELGANDSDKDEDQQRRRLSGKANGSYQPAMGAPVTMPVLPKAVRDSLSRNFPRSRK